MPQKRTDKNGKTRWIGRYRDKNKKEYTKSFPTRREAKQWEDERKTQVTKGIHIAPQQEKPPSSKCTRHGQHAISQTAPASPTPKPNANSKTQSEQPKPSTPQSQTSTDGTYNSSTAAHGWTTNP